MRRRDARGACDGSGRITPPGDAAPDECRAKSSPPCESNGSAGSGSLQMCLKCELFPEVLREEKKNGPGCFHSVAVVSDPLN